MKLTITFEIDDALIEERRSAYALRLSTAATLERLRDTPAVSTLAQWDAAKKAAEAAYHAWGQIDHEIRSNATVHRAKGEFFAQLDAFLTELPQADARTDLLIPARKEHKES